MKNATRIKKQDAAKPVQVVSLQIKAGTKTTIEFLALKREFTLRHCNDSLFRLSDLPGGIPDARNLTRRESMFSTVIQYAWAMLPESAWLEFPRPIDFAKIVPGDDLGQLLVAVGNALLEYAENKRNPAKNG